MKIDLHAGLNPIGDAAHASKYDIIFLPLNMHPIVDFFGITIAKDSFLKKIEYIYAHFIFMWQLTKNYRKDLIIVREFLTVPLFLSWPLYFRFRKKTLFIVNHNLQKAHANKLERMVFKALLRLGMRPLFLDTDTGIRELEIELLNNHYLVLPYPIIKISQKPIHDNKFTVGIIGDNRKEKKIDEIVEALYKVCNEQEIQLLIGSMDTSMLDTWHDKGVKTINTSEFKDYVQAFCLSDVIVLNYDRAAYYYRISGIIFDAIAANTVVICPDYPVLKDQISRYGLAGVTFSDMSDIAAILLYVKENQDEFKAGLLYQQKNRNIQNITALLDSYVESTIQY